MLWTKRELSMSLCLFCKPTCKLCGGITKILSKSRALLASVGDAGEASFYNQLPILGKHPRPYERWTRDDNLGAYKSHGNVDVCLMPIFGRFNLGFFFDGTEKEMSRRRSAEAATLFLHPFHYVAPIPFPSTLRDRGRIF